MISHTESEVKTTVYLDGISVLTKSQKCKDWMQRFIREVRKRRAFDLVRLQSCWAVHFKDIDEEEATIRVREAIVAVDSSLPEEVEA